MMVLHMQRASLELRPIEAPYVGRSRSIPTNLLSENERVVAARLCKDNAGYRYFVASDEISHPFYHIGHYIVIPGKKLGGGFWGEVFDATYYDLNAPDLGGFRCVIKQPIQDTKRMLIGRVVDVRAGLEKEAALNKAIFGLGEIEEFQVENGQIQTIVLMPFLGEMTLESLLQKPAQMHAVPVIEWLKLFRDLCRQLQEVHQRYYLHNDIKPENIGITIRSHEGKIELEGNFFDFGNAHEPNKAGKFGDPKYQSNESLYLGWFAPIKGTSADVYALGYSLHRVLRALRLKKMVTPSENEGFQYCQDLFEAMCSWRPGRRPELDWCVDGLNICINRMESGSAAAARIS